MAYLPRLLRRVFGSVLLFLALLAPALAADITAVRSWRAPDNTRLVFDLTGPVTWQLNPDSTPARLIVDIEGARPAGPLALPVVQAPLKGMRLEPTARGQRLVIDTALELLPKVFQLPPNEKYGHRLVLDLFEKSSPRLVLAEKPAPGGAIASPLPAPGVAALPPPEPVRPAGDAAPRLPAATGTAAEKPAAEKPAAVSPAAGPGTSAAGATGAVAAGAAPTESPLPPGKPEKPPVRDTAGPRPAPADAAAEPGAPEKYDARRFRNIIVAIDAGHGGDDPGAIGKNGTHEKNITLAIARALQERLEAEPGITAVLTRTGDYFIPLQDRRRIARYQHKADIFVSIHADSAPSAAARGASVFALSLKGADTATSRFARMLAERENRADLIGGAALETEDNVLRNVLADMVVAGSLEHSLHMGRNIITGLERVGRLHSPRVEQAGFAVLKEPGMVSLLVETGFISNPDEEKKLTSRQYQQDIANAVAAGVRRYCLQFPAPATYFAWRADRGRAVAADRPARRGREAASPAADVATAAATVDVPGADDAATAAPAAAAVPERTSFKPAETPARPAAEARRDAATRFRTHRVAAGESLTRLSDRYGVTMAALREANRLRDDNIRIGQTLKIPVN